MGLTQGVGHINNTHGLYDGIRNETITRPVTGYTKLVHDGSGDWTATGHASIGGGIRRDGLYKYPQRQRFLHLGIPQLADSACESASPATKSILEKAIYVLSWLYVKAIYLSCRPIGKLSICQASNRPVVVPLSALTRSVLPSILWPVLVRSWIRLGPVNGFVLTMPPLPSYSPS